MSDKPGPDVAAVLYGPNDEPIQTDDGRLCVLINSANLSEGLVYERLLCEGSDEMAVNGGTPKDFIWTPGDVDVRGVSLRLLIENNLISFGNFFAGISPLTIGLTIAVKASDAVVTLNTLKRTRDLLMIAVPGGFELYSSAVDALRTTVRLTDLIFKKAGTYETPDYVKVTVQDNLSGLNHMHACFIGNEV